MPFKSEAQRRFMWAQHPDIAQRWSDKYGSEPARESGRRKPKDKGMAKAQGMKRGPMMKPGAMPMRPMMKKPMMGAAKPMAGKPKRPAAKRAY